MRILDRDALHQMLDSESVFKSQRRAFIDLATGTAQMSPRLLLEGGLSGLANFCYLARLGADGYAVCKIGAVAPANKELALPTVQSLIVALHPVTGSVELVADGDAVTELRTAAASAVAVESLQAGTEELLVVGLGVQARTHLEALTRSRDYAKVGVSGIDRDRTAQFAAQMTRELALEVEPVLDLTKAVSTATVIVLCTTSRIPVIPDSVAPGATVITVGSFGPGRIEVGADLIARAALVVVDDVATALRHGGSVINAIEAGRLDESELVSLGDVLVASHPGRRQPEDIVVFNSVGLGIQDAAVMELLVSRSGAKDVAARRGEDARVRA